MVWVTGPFCESKWAVHYFINENHVSTLHCPRDRIGSISCAIHFNVMQGFLFLTCPRSFDCWPVPSRAVSWCQSAPLLFFLEKKTTLQMCPLEVAPCMSSCGVLAAMYSKNNFLGCTFKPQGCKPRTLTYLNKYITFCLMQSPGELGVGYVIALSLSAFQEQIRHTTFSIMTDRFIFSDSYIPQKIPDRVRHILFILANLWSNERLTLDHSKGLQSVPDLGSAAKRGDICVNYLPLHSFIAG